MERVEEMVDSFVAAKKSQRLNEGPLTVRLSVGTEMQYYNKEVH
jgi:hypothetical protein